MNDETKTPAPRRIAGRLTCGLACLGALAALGAAAAPIGGNFPAGGAYSEVNPSSWASATWPLGAAFTDGPGSTLQVAVYSANATKLVLEIYLEDTGADAAYDYAMARGTDNIWRAAVAGVPNHALYAFRAWGPNWPYANAWSRGNSAAGFVVDCDTQGNRFNPNKVLFDPYARELSHGTWTPAMAASGQSYAMYLSGGADVGQGQTYTGPLSGGAAVNCRNVDDGRWAPKAVVIDDTAPTGPRPAIPQQDAIIYETHLKGLTAHPSSANLTALLSAYSGFQDAANVPGALRGTYAGAAYMAGYLKDLGVNTVEFLPVHDSNDQAESTTAPDSSGGGGYWGYWTYGYFAPNRRYASDQAPGGPTAEFKAMVAAFHNAGIEVYLDVVYNHSGESGVRDSATAAQAEITFFRGLDNSSYYTLTPGAARFYWVTTGCGTNLNCGSAPVQQLVLDSLAYWSQTMGVDGFRFDEGPEMGRVGASGFSGSAPMLQAIAALAARDGFKIVAEPGDYADFDEVGGFPAGWACWNFDFRESVRQYMMGNLTGYATSARGLGYADAFSGDPARMTAEGGPQKSVNFVVCHDGWVMADLVSFDGPVAGLAWPFGPEVDGDANFSSSWGGNQALRRQVIRNFWVFTVLSRGVPLIEYGDELGRTVNGNNNAYDIDSVATWNNYAMLGTDSPETVPTDDTSGGTMPYDNNLGTFANPANANFAFLQGLLHLRSAHAAFRRSDFTSVPVTFSTADGTGAFDESSTLAARIFVAGSQVGDDDFLLLSNVSTAPVTCTVPPAAGGARWVRVIDTSSASEGASNIWSQSAAPSVGGTTSVAAHSVVVLESVAPVPVFTAQPISVTVAGGTIALRATATNAPAYQWYFNGVALSDGSGASGSREATLVISGATAANAGSYYCVATNLSGSAQSAAATVSVAGAAEPGHLINLSCRAAVGTGANVLIVGFAAGGAGTSGEEPLLIRASGPALALDPFDVPGTLPDPALQLAPLNGPAIASNSGWGGSAAIAAAGAAVGAFPWTDASSKDSAILTSLGAGPYTALVSGASGDTGVSLAEVYDATPAGPLAPSTPRLVNLSARDQVGKGANILIAGFVIGGSTSETVLVRASGPALAADPFKVPGTLPDPQLELFRNNGDNTSTLLETNAGWGGDAQVAAAAGSVGAFAWGSPESADSALLVTLPPGAYTAQVSGASGDTGVALVEVYEVR